MTLTRRNLFCATALVAPAALLAGCSAAQAQSVLQTLATAWGTIPGLLANAEIADPNLVIPAATMASIGKALTDLEANADTIVTAVGAPPTTVSQIVSDISLVSTLLTPFFPAASAIGELVGAGVSIAGTLLAEAGVKTASASLKAPPYTFPTAMLILRAAAAK